MLLIKRIDGDNYISYSPKELSIKHTSIKESIIVSLVEYAYLDSDALQQTIRSIVNKTLSVHPELKYMTIVDNDDLVFTIEYDLCFVEDVPEKYMEDMFEHSEYGTCVIVKESYIKRVDLLDAFKQQIEYSKVPDTYWR